MSGGTGMTERARSVWRGFRLPARSRAPEVVPQPEVPLSQVVVSLPDAVPASVRAEVLDGIARRVDGARAALGIRRAAQFTGAPSDDPSTLSVSVDGRPAVVLDLAPGASHDSVWVTRVVAAAEAVMRFRYALLLDDAEAEEHAEAIMAAAGDDRREFYRSVPGYLLDNGISLAGVAALGTDAWIGTEPWIGAEPSAAAVAEVILDRIAPPELHVALTLETARRATSQDSDRITDLRANLFADTGVQLPDLSLSLTGGPPSSIELGLNHLRTTVTIPDPGGWEQVVTAVDQVTRRHVAWFVRQSDVTQLRDRLGDVVGSLVELSRNTYSDAVVAACMRALVRSGGNVRNLPRVLWLLHDTTLGPDTNSVSFTDLSADVAVDPRADPESMASRIRARIADETWRAGAMPVSSTGLTVPAATGRALLDDATRADTEWRLLAAYRKAHPADLVAAPNVATVAAVRTALGALATRPPVVAVQELPIDFALTQLRV